MLVRLRLLFVALAVGAVCAGCADIQQKFDVVPGPIGIALLWTNAPGAECAPGGGEWPCIDELLEVYHRDYQALVRRDAEPLLDAFRRARVDGEWRRDTALMERLIGRQRALLDAIDRLDDAFVAALPRCGVDPGFAARLLVERRIEVRRAVIEGSGAPILDLRRELDPAMRTDAAVEPVLAEYAASLADLLVPLVDAERQRLIRHRRAWERLEAEAPDRRERRNDRWMREAELQAREESSVPIRRALARLMELNLSTLDRLRGVLPESSFRVVEERVHQRLDAGHGGTGGDPSVEWLVRVVCEAEAIPESDRRSLRAELDRVVARDASIAQSLRQSMRAGSTVGGDDPRRGEREALRKELLQRAAALLPPAMRPRFDALPKADDAQKGVLLLELAPSAASRLMATMPPSLRREPDDEPELPQRPDEMVRIFLPPPADQAWLDRSIARLPISEDARRIAAQLWRDDALAALEALEPLHAATKAAESELGRSFGDPRTARQAINAYFAAIDREREVIAAAEERYLDGVAALLPEHERSLAERLRWERRLARERIDWRFMPFADGFGFGAEAGVTAADAVARADLEPHERMIAEAVLDERLPELAAQAASFRAEGLGALRRLVQAIAEAQGQSRTQDRMREALPGIASSVRSSVEFRTARHLDAVEEVASALGPRGLAVRAAWRRAAFPEYFLDDAVVAEAIAVARSRSAEDAALAARVRERIDAFPAELDERESAVMDARRDAIMESPPRRREEIGERLRDWPILAAAVAARREAIGRLLRDLACMTDDPALRGSADDWFRAPRAPTLWVYE